MKSRCSIQAREYLKFSQGANSSWTDIFASFPELHGMFTGQLDLPAIFRPSFDGNYRNSKNLKILKLLKLHAATLPGILGKGERVASIIPSNLHLFFFGKYPEYYRASNALIITTSRVLLALQCTPNSDGHGWIELDPKGFFDSLSAQSRKTDIKLNLVGGYKLVLQYDPPTIRVNPPNSPGQEYDGLRPSQPKSTDRCPAIDFKCLCPVCLQPCITPAPKACPHCQTEFIRPSTTAVQSALLPGLPEYRYCTNRYALWHMIVSLLLLAAVAQSAIASHQLMLTLSSLLVIANHGLSALRAYKISNLCRLPQDPVSI